MKAGRGVAVLLSFGWCAVVMILLRSLVFGGHAPEQILAAAAAGAAPFPIAVFIAGRRQARSAAQIERLDQALLEQRLGSRAEQLNALQSQINPHFLYNTLDTIRSMALEKDQDEIGGVVAALAQMFRYSMDYSNPTVSLAAELAQVDRHMKIQMMRFPGRFEVRRAFECEQEDLKYVKVAKYSLQPLVENAIAHGFRNQSSGCVLTLRMIRLESRFQIIVEDNGAGMEDEVVMELNRQLRAARWEKSAVRAGGGIALHNINDRIKLLYSAEYGLRVMSTKGVGTSVVITLPMQELK